jgi:hypothetical protein
VRRRELVLAAAGAVLAGRPAAAAGAVDRDPEILDRLVAREDAAAFAYRERVVVAAAELHESHAKALRTQIAALGRAGPAPPRDTGDLDAPARRLAEAPDGVVWQPVIALEESLLADYEDALRRLVEPSILRTAATIAASHAQYLALHRREAGLDPLGSP